MSIPLVPPIDKIANTELDEIEQLREMIDGPWKRKKMNISWKSQITEMMICKGCHKHQQCTIKTLLCKSCFFSILKMATTVITNHNKTMVVGFSNNDDILIPRFQRSMKVLTHAEWIPIQDKIASFYKKTSPQKIHDVNEHRIFLNNSDSKNDGADKRTGFVYLLRAENGLYKIGKTIGNYTLSSRIGVEWGVCARKIILTRHQNIGKRYFGPLGGLHGGDPK